MSYTVEGLMELVIDHSVDSMRLGSYEARAPYTGIDKWKIIDLREKRIKSREAVRAYAAALAQGEPSPPQAREVPEGWTPVSERLPDDGALVLVYTPPRNGEDERIDFEWCDDGAWGEHLNSFDHFMCVTGGKGCLDDGTPCTGPSEDAPYTHWMPLPAAPSIGEPSPQEPKPS